MRTRPGWPLALLLATSALATPATIQSSGLTLSVDSTSPTNFTLVDRATGTTLTPDGGSPLFALHTPTTTFTAASLVSPAVSGSASSSGQTLTVSGALAGDAGVSVVVQISATTGAPELTFTLQLTNTGQQLDEVDCPVLHLAPQLGATQSDDQVFIPGGDGSVTTGTAIFSNWMFREYPGSASMQVAAYFDADLGLAVASHDATGEPKQVGSQGTTPWVELRMKHRAPAVVGGAIPAIPVVIYPVKGSWMAALAPYRAWARSQPFAAKRTGANAVAPWVRAAPVTFESDLLPQGMGVRVVPLTDAGVLFDQWRQALGPSMLPLYRSFERYGTYASPFYTPLSPSDAELATLFQDVKAHGHHTMAMVAGLKWLKQRAVYPNPQTSPSYWVPGFTGLVDNGLDGGLVDGWTGPVWNGSSFDPPADQVCAIQPNGQVLIDAPFSSWDGTKGYMCAHHPFATTVLTRLARHLSQRGLDLFELDQMNGGETKPCYSTTHGHPPGYGRWMSQDLAALMAAIKAEGRTYNPDFALTMEDPGELWLPFMDLMLCRPPSLEEWPATGPGSTVVPAFEFAYGDLVRCQSADYNVNTRGVPFLETFNEQHSLVKLGRVFASGSLLYVNLNGWMLVSQFAPPPSGWPTTPYSPAPPADALLPTPTRTATSHLTLLRHMTATANGPALPYLVDGLMANTAPPTLPTFTYLEKVWNGTANVDAPRTIAAGNFGAFQLSDGGFAQLLVNPQLDGGLTVSLPSVVDGIAIGSTTNVAVYRNGVLERTTTFGAASPVTLAPLDVVAVTSSTPTVDAGQPIDAGLDAGPSTDAGLDAGNALSDAGAPDAGAPDAGPQADAGAPPDAGPLADAGLADAGLADAGLADAGPVDAGQPDAGPLAPLVSGCGCTSVDTSLLWAGAALALAFRRRQRW